MFVVPRTRPPYPPEFRRQAIELVRSGTPLKQVAVELGVSEQTLRNWRRQREGGGGRAGGVGRDARDRARPAGGRRGSRRGLSDRGARGVAPLAAREPPASAGAR